jgi:hypothetical protein
MRRQKKKRLPRPNWPATAFPRSNRKAPDRCRRWSRRQPLEQRKPSSPGLCFLHRKAGEFRSQWSTLQTGFVDEPRGTVEGADKLVASVLQKLAEDFVTERSSLVQQWESSDKVSTEDLRVALRSYRSFFNRLLKL